MKELSIDKILFVFFNGNHSVLADKIMQLASNMIMWIPVYLIVLFLFARVLKLLNPSYFITNTILVTLCMGMLVLICVQWLPAIFPYFVNRVKPCYDEELSSMIRVVGNECQDKYGFFAVRACTVFAFTTFLSLAFDGAFKWMKAFLICWALLVCYSRVYLGAQYPFNVLVSAASGVIIGYLTFRIYFYIKDSLLVI